ncbi:MAG: transaldolase [Phycisphaerae bacterium]|nr:transaldolase [Phycisphaerae bacterium]
MASAKINPRTQALHDVGQSLWLDNITRELLSSGTLQRYIQELSVTGLTSNPTIFDHAISKSTSYDAAIGHLRDTGNHSTEDIFFRLAIDDLQRAADLFRPVYDRTHGVDGFVSLEVSPLLAYDTAPTLAAAKDLWTRAARANLFIKIPGTAAGLPAIEEAIFHGIPINVTLLFSARQYVAAAEAYTRGVERRVAAGLNPRVGSVASVFISRWDKAVMGKAPEALRNQLGLAVANYTYKAYRELIGAGRWKKLIAAGAMPQRLLWASTGTKDPQAPDTLYISALAAPDTINTMPEETLLAFADHGTVAQVMACDVGWSQDVVKEFAKVGFQVDALAEQLQREGAASFVKSWNELMGSVQIKGAKLAAART